MYTSHYVFSCIHLISEDSLLGLYSSVSFVITQEKMLMPLYSLDDLKEKAQIANYTYLHRRKLFNNRQVLCF